jgi:hypothetical protein
MTLVPGYDQDQPMRERQGLRDFGGRHGHSHLLECRGSGQEEDDLRNLLFKVHQGRVPSQPKSSSPRDDPPRGLMLALLQFGENHLA